jgi:hypothetical protein
MTKNILKKSREARRGIRLREFDTSLNFKIMQLDEIVFVKTLFFVKFSFYFYSYIL